MEVALCSSEDGILNLPSILMRKLTFLVLLELGSPFFEFHIPVPVAADLVSEVAICLPQTKVQFCSMTL